MLLLQQLFDQFKSHRMGIRLTPFATLTKFFELTSLDLNLIDGVSRSELWIDQRSRHRQHIFVADAIASP